jgi:hypothetical protein
MEEKKEEEKVKSQCIEPVVSFVAVNVMKAIVGYIAIYFFKPVWEYLLKMINKKRGLK